MIYDKFKVNFNLLDNVNVTDANDFDINVIKVEMKESSLNARS